jgi:predicted HTH domain antitoxin
MKDLQLTIPGDILATTKIPRQHLEAQLKKELALQLYREGLISGGGACRLAGLTKLEFQDLLGERGICQQYGQDDYQRDLENLAAWQAHE